MAGLFIVGCPRSGTSLLQKLMSSHPDVALGLERFNEKNLSGSICEADFAPERFFDIRPGDTWYRTFDTFGPEYTPTREKYERALYRGDKTPRAFLMYRQLAGVFPDTRFLFIFRNIFSVAASYEGRRATKTTWRNEWDYKAAVDHWNTSISETLKYMEYISILPIFYNDLFEDSMLPEKLCRFLEIDPIPLQDGFKRERNNTPAARSGIQLTDTQCDYISLHADFENYKKILEMSRVPPLYSKPRENRGVGPAVVDAYSKDDRRVIDYNGYQLAQSPYVLRGPMPSAKYKDSIICIGSAATFGRLVKHPFAQQISEALDVPVFNFGIGGARPSTYLSNASLKDALSCCRVAVVEAMSARGYRSSIFVPNNPHSNLGQTRNFEGPKTQPTVRESFFVDRVYSTALATLTVAELHRICIEIRSAYMADMRQIAGLVKGKGILLYLSQRAPDYQQSATSYEKWSGGFPHFINEDMLSLLSDLFESRIDLVSKSGLPNPLLDKETGEPVPVFVGAANETENHYYPSPKMHDETAELLIPAIRKLLA